MRRGTFRQRWGKIELIIHKEIDTSTYTNNQNELMQMVRKEIVNDM